MYRLSLDNNNTSKEQAQLYDEEQVTPIPIPEPGENVEISSFDEMAVPVNQHMETDDLCYSVSEVKLYRLTNSELEKYLGSMPNDKTSTVHAKGDNEELYLTVITNNLLLFPSSSSLHSLLQNWQTSTNSSFQTNLRGY